MSTEPSEQSCCALILCLCKAHPDLVIRCKIFQCGPTLYFFPRNSSIDYFEARLGIPCSWLK